jgi:3-hydroxyisobutyrate dehydrogenase-like beta-hydroxyacid dehydrogenase
MSEKPRIGFIGVGLMGHGAAKHIMETGGFPLTILGHRNREPVEDLVRRGAVEAASAADLARRSDAVVLCLPSSVEVEAIVYAGDGLLAGLAVGTVVIDATTADPAVTRRIGADLAVRGIALVDAPLGRSARDAEAGRLSTYVGGTAEHLERVRPILQSYCDTIVHCGPLGAGTTCKLVNNSITIGMAAVISEAFATAAKAGVDLNALSDVISAGGADGRIWRVMQAWIRDGDDSALKGTIWTVAKDLRAYAKLAESAGTAVYIAQAVSQTLRTALNLGHAETFLPQLPGILATLNGTRIRD